MPRLGLGNGPSAGYATFNPATYVPPAFPQKTSFTGNLGPDGHYSSFSIQAMSPRTGNTLIINYFIYDPYYAPTYYWNYHLFGPNVNLGTFNIQAPGPYYAGYALYGEPTNWA
jgi:hypothetical protein